MFHLTAHAFVECKEKTFIKIRKMNDPLKEKEISIIPHSLRKSFGYNYPVNGLNATNKSKSETVYPETNHE